MYTGKNQLNAMANADRVHSEQHDFVPFRSPSGSLPYYTEEHGEDAWHKKHAHFTASAAEFRPDFIDSGLKLSRLPNPDASDFIPTNFYNPAPSEGTKEGMGTKRDSEGGLGSGLETAGSFKLPWKKVDPVEEFLKKGVEVKSEVPNSSSLESIFHDSQATKPEFCLPTCYYIKEHILKLSHILRFSSETLFYIFYNFPGEHLQTLAAADL
jgi:hypothetical protein